MEECELCGRPTKDIYVIEVENVEMRVDAGCAKGKKVIRTEIEGERLKAGRQPARQRRATEETPMLVDNYGKKIRNARENMKLPIKVLAEMINEKEHFLVRIEEERTKPTIELTKKLEKTLKIKLTEEPMETSDIYKGGTKRAEKATIGDFVEEKEG